MDNRSFKSNKNQKRKIGKIVKWFLITIVVLLITLLSVPFLFKGKLIEIAKSEINKNLNAKVNFGDFNLSLIKSFPDFNFSINDISIDGKDKFKDIRLAEIKKIEFSLNLMSVIKGNEMKINTIGVTEPKLNVLVLKDSSANYDIMIADSLQVEDSTSTEDTKFDLSLSKLFINNAFIDYNDQTSNLSAKIEKFDYEMSGNFDEKNYDTDNKLQIEKITVSESGINYINKAKILIDAIINIQNLEKFTLKENNFKLNEIELKLDGWTKLQDDKVQTDLKFLTNKNSFKNILSLIPVVYTKEFSTIQTKGNVELNGSIKGDYSYEKDDYPSFNLDFLISDAYFKYPDLPKACENINIKTKISHPQGKLDLMSIDISKFHLDIANNPIDFFANITTPMSDLNIKSEILAKINLDNLSDVIHFDNQEINGLIDADVKLAGKMSDLEAQQYHKFSASGNIIVKNMNYKAKDLNYSLLINDMNLNISPQTAKLNSFDCKIGNSDLKINGSIFNLLQYYLKGETLKADFNISSEYLDLDQLMNYSSSEKPIDNTSVKKDSNNSNQQSQIIEIPANYDVNLKTNIAKLKYDGLEIQNIGGNLLIKDRVADLSNLKMNMLDGSLSMSGIYDTKNTLPKIDLKFNLNQVDIKKTAEYFKSIKQMTPVAKYCNGKISTVFNINSELDNTMMPKLMSANANGVLQSNNIDVQGLKTLIKLSEALKLNELANQKIENLNLSFFMENGKLNIKPFDTKISGMKTNIQGYTSLDKSIEYIVKIDVPKDKMGKNATNFLNGVLNNNKITQDLIPNLIPVTFKIGGTVDNPKIIGTSLSETAGNLKNLIVDKVKDTVNKVIQQNIDKGLEEAQKQVDKILSEASNQAQRIRNEGKNAADKIKNESKSIADKVKADAYNLADQLVSKAKNPIEKFAAEKAAEKAKKEADKKYDKALSEVNNKASIVENEANKRADQLENEAKNNADRIMNEAKSKSQKVHVK